MNDKEKYLQAMKTNNGRLDELSLGEIVGFDTDTTNRILSAFLSEYKIVYETHGLCNYKVKK